MFLLLSFKLQVYDVISLAKRIKKFQSLFPDGDLRHCKIFRYRIDDRNFSSLFEGSLHIFSVFTNKKELL